MIHSVQQLQEIATQSRCDFEANAVDPGLLGELITTHLPHQAERWKNQEPGLTELVSYALTQFPLNNCGIATLYLRHQLGYGEPIDGYYGRSRHVFLNVGETALGDETIVDITADQFRKLRPRAKIAPVYVGALQAPWSKP